VRYEEDLYFKEVMRFVDGTAIMSTADPGSPLAPHSWLRGPEIAALLHRARLFVLPSPEESFCIALLESLACGTTCVVNGRYYGLGPQNLGSHVFGSVTEKKGFILDWLDSALQQDVRIDASTWAGKFALTEIKPKLLRFIQQRC
jgi:hypothetical protein